MFGYVKPFVPELKVRQNDLYRALYCGLCHRMKKLTGYFSAFSLSYDFVFLALVRSAVTGENISATEGRCAYNPLRKKKIAAPSRSLDYTCAVGAVLGYYKVLDDIEDTKGIGKLKYLSILPVFSSARKKALRFGVPDKEVKELLARLSDLERRGIHSPHEAADIFGELLGVIASYGVEDDIASFALREIFESVGRWIYLIDGVDDLCSDLKKGRYNPFSGDVPPNFEAIKNTLQMTLTSADRIIIRMNVNNPDVYELIKNIVLLGSDEVENKVLEKAKKDFQAMKGTNK